MNVPLTPLRFLDRAGELYANKVGVVCGAQTFTYAQFAGRARRLASALRRAGITTGDRVAYLSFNNHELLEGYYGVVQAGAVVMPLNVRLSVPELIAILNHSGARLLVYESEFAPVAESLRAGCPALARTVPIGPEYEALLDTGDPEPADWLSVDENSTAELFYTSGSTGTPKGVELSHRTLYLHALNAVVGLAVNDETVDLHTIPLFHANGWGRPQFSTMLGTKQVMVRRFDPGAVCALIQEHRATDMSLVPVMLNALINFADIGKYDLSSLRRVMIGGAAASPELIQRAEAALGCEAISGYGMTESAPAITVSRRKSTLDYSDPRERLKRQAMAGWPLPGVEIRVVDGEGRPVPRDLKSIGEVIARGDQIMTGYFKEPAVTAQTIRNGWLHTGDMAVWDEEGYIHIVDRKKEIIISGGENISSLEVEKAIFAHPAVFECAVVAAPDEKWGEVPAAIVVLKEGETLSQEELVQWLTERLGRFKLPRVIEFSTEPLPKTGTGKIRKLVLRERFWSGKEKRVQG